MADVRKQIIIFLAVLILLSTIVSAQYHTFVFNEPFNNDSNINTSTSSNYQVTGGLLRLLFSTGGFYDDFNDGSINSTLFIGGTSESGGNMLTRAYRDATSVSSGTTNAYVNNKLDIEMSRTKNITIVLSTSQFAFDYSEYCKSSECGEGSYGPGVCYGDTWAYLKAIEWNGQTAGQGTKSNSHLIYSRGSGSGTAGPYVYNVYYNASDMQMTVKRNGAVQTTWDLSTWANVSIAFQSRTYSGWNGECGFGCFVCASYTNINLYNWTQESIGYGPDGKVESEVINMLGKMSNFTLTTNSNCDNPSYGCEYNISCDSGLTYYNDAQNNTVTNCQVKDDSLKWVLDFYTTDGTATPEIYNLLFEGYNWHPTFNQSLGSTTIIKGIQVDVDANCSDSESDTITYYDDSDNVTVNPSTGFATINTSLFNYGIHTVRFTCNDTWGGDYSDFTFNVRSNAPTAPEWLKPGSQNYSEQITFSLSSESFCYQESFNISNQTGIDGDCGLQYTGHYSPAIFATESWEPGYPPSNFLDGNWSTYALANQSKTAYGYFYINYTLPDKVTNNSLMVFKNGITTYNFNIPSLFPICWERAINNNILELSYVALHSNVTGFDYSYGYCWNGTDWNVIHAIANSGGLYEEAMNWSIGEVNNVIKYIDLPGEAVVTNVTNIVETTISSYGIDVGSTGAFITNISNETAFINAYNNYLTNNCTDYITCNIPLVFSAGEAGDLNFSTVVIYDNESLGQVVNISWANATDLDNDTITYTVEAQTDGGWFSVISGILNNWYNWVVDFVYTGPISFRVKATDQWNDTSNWTYTGTSLIDTTGMLVDINQLYVTPTYPLHDDDLDCNFNVSSDEITGQPIDVNVTWYITYGAGWSHITNFDYTFVGVNENQLYTTGDGTGRFTNYLGNVQGAFCQITAYNNNVANATTTGNSTDVHPFTINIIYPDVDPYESSQQLNVTSYVTNLDGGMECWLNINGSNIKYVGAISSGQNFSINYTPSADGTYYWNISCNATGNPELLYSETREFRYDGVPPTFSNYFDDSTPDFPQIGDTITLGATVDDTYTVDTCIQMINDNGTWWNASVYTILQPGPYNLSTYFTVRNVSTADNNNVSWRLWCNDSSNNGALSLIQNFSVKDRTAPIIVIGPNSSFDDSNTTIISNALHNLTIDMEYIDYNVFQAAINITCDTNGTIYYWEDLDINVSPENFTYRHQDIADLTDLEMQRCTFFTQVTDDHTAFEIPEYDFEELNNGLRYVTEAGNTIEILYIGEDESKLNDKDKNKTKKDKDNNGKGLENGNGNKYGLLKESKTKKEKDRYKFGFKFEEDLSTRTFLIKADHIIYPRVSRYPAHVVVWNDETKMGNWIDFGEAGIGGRDYAITKISDYEYIVEITALSASEIEVEQSWYDWLLGREPETEIVDGIKEINFESLGGTNQANATYYFYIGAAINVSTYNMYNSSPFGLSEWPINVTISTVDAYPSFDGTIELNYSYPYIDNILSNGTYSMIFDAPHYLNKTYSVLVENNSQDLIYNTSHSVLYIGAYKIKTYQNLTGLNITVTNLDTAVVKNVYNTTGVLTPFYLDAGNYNITIEKPGLVSDTLTTTMTYKENKTIWNPTPFLATFNFWDERTLEQFNLSSADRVSFLLFCPDSTYTTIINETNQSIPIDCDYIKFKFILDYGTTSYYRTFILTPDEADEVNIYLINLLTTNSIYNSFIVDDLLSEYDNVRVFIKKIINNQTEQITADYVDIENKIGAFLIENHEYIIEIHSDNQPVRVMGSYSADVSGDKSLRLYDITLNVTASEFVNVMFTTQMQNISGDSIIVTDYYDPENQTTNLRWRVYQDSYNGTLLYETTSSSQDIEFTFNATPYLNHSLYTELSFDHPQVEQGTYTDVRLVNEVTAIALEAWQYISPWFGWFLTILLSAVAIMATIRTANYAAILICGLAVLFKLFGWYSISGGILALGILVALMSLLKEGDKRTT